MSGGRDKGSATPARSAARAPERERGAVQVPQAQGNQSMLASLREAGLLADAGIEREAHRLALGSLSARELPGRAEPGLEADLARTALPTELAGAIARPGVPLSLELRQRFSASLGVGLEGVRVHTDMDAQASARSLKARAYTVGEHIVFGSGAWAPGTLAGLGLLAHELAHVAQQARSGTVFVARDAEGEAHPEEDWLELSRRALARIHPLLETGICDWYVTESDARQALAILRALPPRVFLHARLVMRMSGDLRRLVENLSAEDRLLWSELDMRADPNVGYVMEGDDIRLEVWSGSHSQSELALDYNVRREGVRVMLVENPVQITGMLPADAATAIARAYHEAQIFFEPQIRLLVTRRGAHFAPRTGPTAQSFWFDSHFTAPDRAEAERLRRFSEYMSYISVVHADDAFTANALGHYHGWLESHRMDPALLTRSPADLWRWALAQAAIPAPESPARGFLDLMHRQHARMLVASGAERSRLQGALQRYMDWLDRHMADPDLASRDPVEVWAQAFRQTLSVEIEESRHAFLADRDRPATDTPEQARARDAKFGKFMQLAMLLWGFTARSYPRLVPIREEGRGYLITGDAAHQEILNELARSLMNWASDHMFDAGYLTANPRSVLSDLFNADIQARWRRADTEPLQSEPVVLHDLLPSRVIASFGETVALGLLVIGAAGAAVGLGVPAAVVGGVLLTVAGISAIISYISRRDEIERGHVEVPIPETIVASVGDVVGLTQVIEGLTGERSGSGRRLDSVERSDSLGSGAGNVVVLLMGSRMFRVGEARGASLRLSTRGAVPATPMGNLGRYQPSPFVQGLLDALPEASRRGFDAWLQRTHMAGHDPGAVLQEWPAGERAARVRRIAEDETRLLDIAERVRARETAAPTAPVAGDPVAAARARLPQELRLGFDEWVDGLRRAGNDPVAVLRRMTEAAVRRAAERESALVQRAMEAALRRQRLASDPLRPATAFVEQRGRVTLRFNRAFAEMEARALEIAEAEIAQCQRIAEATGEPVSWFGDSPMGTDYPGIDGSIGAPPRPLSLKRAASVPGPHDVPNQANGALGAARATGYSHVEVHLFAEGTMAAIQAQWTASPLRPVLFDDVATIARYVIHCGDGMWTVEPPISRGMPGVGLPSGERRRDTPDAGSPGHAAGPPEDDEDLDAGSPDAGPPAR